MMDLWAVVPVKERDRAKERLAPLLPADTRQALALAMLEDVLSALAAVEGLAGLVVVTVDLAARRLALRYGARVVEDGARDGHTGAVTAAARLLAAEGHGGMLTLPGDIPLVTADEIGQVVVAHRPAPSFTIVPSHDEGGSNAVLLSPPDAVPLRFGVDSFFPHLRAAEAQGIRPTVLRLSGIALDIDNPEDLAAFLRTPSQTQTRALLDERGALTAPLTSWPGSISSSKSTGNSRSPDRVDARIMSGQGEQGQEDLAQ
ncbi:MAG TPA: 2-phospho-L-lactate guanylyltransferase [Stellaceae bacterium]|jgi:2-phospho-L-lactate/phosphoenolpyruvate guanylyltransferase|nr:2-phospho-L-lactate guanylyltransferase [Stellaceae bacterium]